ncbi:MAG: ABC transporter substrate-binding protein [Flavobacteriales bacterium]
MSKKRKNTPLVHWVWALTVLGLLAASAGCGLGAGNGVERAGKQVFRYNESAAITSLDPAAARSLEHMWVVDQLYDGLVELNADLEVVPCVAKSWEVDPVTHTYTFHLRPGVAFSSGRSVDASDVVFSLERLRDPSVVSSGGWILDAVVPEGIRAVDDSTVTIQLSQAYPPFLGLLTTAYGAIVNRVHAQTEGVSLRNQPGGTGPFVLKWWLEDAGLVLHPNPGYWERDEEDNPLPYLDAVHIDVVQDMGSEFLGLTQGRYDFISGLHPSFMETLLDQEGGLRSSFAGELRLEHVPFLKTDYLGVVLDGSQTPPALKNPMVRQALSLALDRPSLVKHLRRNSVSATDRFVPPSMLGRPAPHPVRLEVDSAKAMLADAGYADGKGVGTVVVSTTSDYADLCAAIQHDWTALGLDVQIDVLPSSVLRERVAQGEVAVFYKSWLADHPDAENFLGLFVKANFSPGGPNYTHHHNPEFENMYWQALMLSDDELGRRALYLAMDSLVHSEMPVIPLFHDRVTHVLREDVEGWAISPVNRLDLRRVKKGA